MLEGMTDQEIYNYIFYAYSDEEIYIALQTPILFTLDLIQDNVIFWEDVPLVKKAISICR